MSVTPLTSIVFFPTLEVNGVHQMSCYWYSFISSFVFSRRKTFLGELFL